MARARAGGWARLLRRLRRALHGRGRGRRALEGRHGGWCTAWHLLSSLGPILILNPLPILILVC
eukprot:1156453-Pyramimonas_sp.AAC.1